MSLLSRILGRRTPPPPAPAPVVAAPPPPPPSPSDTLVLTGAGLEGADPAAAVEVTVTIGERTFSANATRREPGTAFPAEFGLSPFAEVVPEPAPADEVVAEPTDPTEIAVVRRPLTDADGAVPAAA